MDLTCAYQPIVSLETGDIFGYEALARDASGKFPAALFAAARENGTLGALDWECRAIAVQGALDAGLRPPAALFINTEPGLSPPEKAGHLLSMLMRATRSLNIYTEITERAIAKNPAELIAAVQRMRMLNLGVAIDDVGADPRSLALLPVIKPDVIKLDLSLVQAEPGVTSAAVITAVRAYSQASGASILAEGVETEQHLLNARTLGATLAQGWLFGHPGPLPRRRPIIMNELQQAPEMPVPPPPELPTDIANRTLRMTPANKRFLISISRHLEHQALMRGAEAIIVSSFQHERFFTGATRRRYARLANTVALVVALGEGMPEEPAPGVKGGALDPSDGLTDEWIVAVVGPHYRAALVARDLGDAGPESERRFEFALMFDTAEVVDIVTALLSRANTAHLALPLAA